MSLLHKIKDDSLTARKDRDVIKSALLTTLYSEAAMVGKNNGNNETTDAEVIAVVKKFIKGNDEVIQNVTDQARHEIALHEKALLLAYLPKQLSDDELRVIVGALVETLTDRSIKQTGKIVAELKAKYSGQYDGAAASKIIKEFLG